MEKKILVSAIAEHFYKQAEGGEIAATCAYAFDTLTLEKAEYDAYNKLAANEHGLSLKTMRNRATAARALQKKYGVKIAGYADIEQSAIMDFTAFLRDQMRLAGSYRYTVEDIVGFCAGEKPAHIQREEYAEEQELIRKTKAAAKGKAEAEKKAAAKARADADAERKAENENDTSGTVDAERAPVPDAVPTVGNADESEQRGEPVADITPVMIKGEEREAIFMAGFNAAVDSFLFTIERNVEDGGLIVEGLVNLE